MFLPTIFICLHLQQVVEHLVRGSLDNMVPTQGDSLQQHDLTTMLSQFHGGGLHLQEDPTKVHLLNTQEGTVVITCLNRCTPENGRGERRRMKRGGGGKREERREDGEGGKRRRQEKGEEVGVFEGGSC